MSTGIYKITNTKNGKIYIGSSSDLIRREHEHFNDLANNKHTNNYLQNAYNLDGKDNFIFSIIELCNKNDLLIREQSYLDTLTPFRENGYNISTMVGGGDIFNSLCDDAKRSMILKVTKFGEDNPMYGRKHTESTIQKQKEKSIGRYTLDWFIENYGEVNGTIRYGERGEKRSVSVSGENNPFYGKVMTGSRFKGKRHSDETKQKMWDSRKTIKDDVLFMEMIRNKSISFTEIGKHFNVSEQTIRYHCKKINDGNVPSYFRK